MSAHYCATCGEPIRRAIYGRWEHDDAGAAAACADIAGDRPVEPAPPLKAGDRVFARTDVYGTDSTVNAVVVEVLYDDAVVILEHARTGGRFSVHARNVALDATWDVREGERAWHAYDQEEQS